MGALKMKPSERGNFALKAIDFGEATLSEGIASLAERIAHSETEVAKQIGVVDEAKEALKVAQQTLDQRTDEFISAENSLLAATTSETEARAAVKALIPEQKTLEEALHIARTELNRVRDLSAKFDELSEEPSPVRKVELQEPQSMENSSS